MSVADTDAIDATIGLSALETHIRYDICVMCGAHEVNSQPSNVAAITGIADAHLGLRLKLSFAGY